MLRHTELNTDIVTWTRLLNRSGTTNNTVDPAHSSPMVITTSDKAKQDSPPHSPHTSGGSTPKSPATPTSPAYFEGRKRSIQEGTPVNGELPPPIPMTEEDLIVGVPPGANEPIIPPPQEFLGGTINDPRVEDNIVPPPRGMFDSWVMSPTHGHASSQKPRMDNGREVNTDVGDGPLMGVGPVLVQAPPNPLLFTLGAQVCGCVVGGVRMGVSVCTWYHYFSQL